MDDPRVVVSSRRRVANKYRKYPELANGYHLSFAEGYDGFSIPPGVRYLYVQVSDTCPLLNPQRGLMTGEQMLQVLAFLRAWVAEEEAPLVVNCAAGRSRSTAGGVIAHYLWGESYHSEPSTAEPSFWSNRPCYNQRNAAAWIYSVYPKATPNGWFLKLADAMLGTNLFGACQHRDFVKWTERRRPA